jgi:hypothetical protein
MKERLADELADHYLDRDPTKVPDWKASARRAQLALDVDPDNLKARCFLLRLHTHHAESEESQGNHNFDQLGSELDAVKRHAEWLAERLPRLPAERTGQIKSDLAAYYQQIGDIKHAAGQKTTGDGNDATQRLDNVLNEVQRGRITPYEARNRLTRELQTRRRALEATRDHYRASDAAYQKSLHYDPLNARANQRVQQHRSEFSAIEDLLNETNRLVRELS